MKEARDRSPKRYAFGTLGAIWGVVGVGMLLTSAVLRLGVLGIEALSHPLGFLHWLVLAVWVPFMVFSEGYRGFHRGFSPRVAARALYLREHPTVLRVLFAPLFCMGFFHATRRRKIAAFALTAGIVTLVLLVSRLPQPWRGIVDIGVVLGILAGLISLAYFVIRAFWVGDLQHPPETPDGTG